MSWVPPDGPPAPPERPAGGPVDGGPASWRRSLPDGPPQWAPTGSPGPATSSPSPDRRAGVGPWRRSGRRTTVLAVALAVLLLTGIGAAALLLAGDDEPGTSARPGDDTAVQQPTTAPPPVEEDGGGTGGDPDAPSPPAGVAELEAVVAELSEYVAEVRGAPFPEPVTVELLEPDAFNARLLDGYEEDREDIDLVGRLLVALQLLGPDDDLFEIYREYLGSGVLGFYDTETGELVVRGAAVTPYTRLVIVHELTHAHDDQRFELYRPELRDATDESALAFSALVEGNAVRVQQRWEGELTADEQRGLLSEQLAIARGIDFSALPPVLLQQQEFPYTSGAVLVEALLEAGGEARVDAAFADPPTTSEQVLDPARYLEGEGAAPVPAPPADGEVVDEGSFGQLTLAITLGSATDRETATDAAEGWGGDSYVAWEEGDRTCVRVAFVMDTGRDLAELVEAWEIWSDSHDDAAVVSDADSVTVTACG